MAPNPPWCDLPLEILSEIFSPLEKPDMIRVSAVCTAFAHAVTFFPKLQQWYGPLWQSLGVREPSDANQVDIQTDENQDDQIVVKNYLSLLEKRVYKITFEEPFSSMHVIGLSHGWFILADNMSNLHLFKPLTRNHILLPSVTTIDGISPMFDDDGNLIKYAMNYFGEIDVEKLHHHFKVILSCNPVKGDYIVVVIHAVRDPSEILTQAITSFVRKGDDCWTRLHADGMLFYSDLVFHNQVLYGVKELGGVDVWDFTTKPWPSLRVIVEDTNYDDDDGYDTLLENLLIDKYIMHAPWGEILVVWRQCVDIFVGNHLHQKTGKIIIYEVDSSKGTLMEMENLGDYTIFLGQTSECFSAQISSYLKTNCVYFNEYYCKHRASHLCVYDVRKKIFEFEEQIQSSRSLCLNVLMLYT